MWLLVSAHFFLTFKFTSAPFMIRYFISSTLPFKAHKCKGLYPATYTDPLLSIYIFIINKNRKRSLHLPSIRTDTQTSVTHMKLILLPSSLKSSRGKDFVLLIFKIAFTQSKFPCNTAK